MSKESSRNPEGAATKRNTTVRIFSSFEEENAAEHRRLAGMSPEERMRELAELQNRRWGESWGQGRMELRATWEQLGW